VRLNQAALAHLARAERGPRAALPIVRQIGVLGSRRLGRPVAAGLRGGSFQAQMAVSGPFCVMAGHRAPVMSAAVLAGQDQARRGDASRWSNGERMEAESLPKMD
jgi:hypothetical protein